MWHGARAGSPRLTRKHRNVRWLPATAAVGLLSAGSHAADVTSTWTGDGNWSNPANWSNNPPITAYPNDGFAGKTYDAVVGSGANPLLDQNITIDHLFFDAGSFGSIGGTGNLTILNGGTWNSGTFSTKGTITLAQTGMMAWGVGGTGSLVLDSTFINQGTVNWSRGDTGSDQVVPGGTFINRSTLNISNSVSFYDSFDNKGNVNILKGGTLMLEGGTATFEVNSVLTGAGTLSLNNANSTTIDGSYNIGELRLGGLDSNDFGGFASINGSGTIGIVDIEAGGLTNAGNLTGTQATNNNGTWNTGNGTLTLQALTLNGGQTTIGSTAGTVNANQVIISGGANIVSAGATLNVGSGGLIINTSSNQNIITLNGGAKPAVLRLGGDVVCTSGGSITSQGPANMPGIIDLGGGLRSFTISGNGGNGMQISANITNGAIRKDGPGQLQLQSPSTYSGGTTIVDGTLEADDPQALGTGPVTFAGGTLALAPPSGSNMPNALVAAPTDSINLTLLSNLTGPPNYTFGGLTLGTALNVSRDGFNLTGSITFAGPITLPQPGQTSNPTTINGAGFQQGSGNLPTIAFNAPVSGGTGLVVNQVALVMGGLGDNSYTGETQVISGALTLSKPAGVIAVPGPLAIIGASTVQLTAPQQIAPTAPVRFDATGGSPTLDLNNNDQSIGALSGLQPNAGTILLGSATLTLGADNSSFTFGGTISGSGRVIKAGTGSVTLNGANNFTGGAGATGGALTLATSVPNQQGSYLASGTWTVSGGGTLSLAAEPPINDLGTSVTMSGQGSRFTNLSALTNLEGSLTVDNGATFVTAGGLANGGTLAVNSGASVSIGGALIAGGLLTIDGGTVHLARNGGASFAYPTITDDGRLDIANNNFTLTKAPTSTVSRVLGYLSSGYDGGRWDGPGIDTSAGDAHNGLGFAVQPVAPFLYKLTIAYTRDGDANLDGKVSFDDLVVLAQNYGTQSGAGWSRGDFNYDGKVDFKDLVILAQNYGQSVTALTASGLDPMPEWKAEGSAAAVPEPAIAGLLACGTLVRIRRRR